jgi:hypothetical protein
VLTVDRHVTALHPKNSSHGVDSDPAPGSGPLGMTSPFVYLLLADPEPARPQEDGQHSQQRAEQHGDLQSISTTV